MEERSQRQPLLSPARRQSDATEPRRDSIISFSPELQRLLSPATRQSDYTDRRESIVSFGTHDPDNPLEWSKKYKWVSVLLLFMFAAVVTYTCVGIVPVASDIVKELEGHKDRTASVIFVTIWELGEAMGPLFIAPLSELYGRFRVYNIANCFFIAGIVIAALGQSVGVLIFARFATGCAVATNVLNPAIISDMFPSESRGTAMSAVMLAPLIGGALGPTVSGVLADAVGWRALMWLCVAVGSVIEILFFFYFRETYHPVILERRAAEKRKETGDDSWTTEYVEMKQSAAKTVSQAMLRPALIFWHSHVLQIMSLWGGVMFAFFYVNSVALPAILEDVYDFNPTKRGLSYLAWSLGSAIGILTCNRSMDRIYRALSKRHGKYYPEGRLPLVIVGAFLLPTAVTLYGWTAQIHAPVFVYLATVTLLCISVVFSLVPLITFITDAFGEYSASAMTAVLVIRCLMGAFLPMTVPLLANKVGYGWGLTVLAAIALSLSPIPCIVMRYGPSWRQDND